MSVPAPHFLLFSQARAGASAGRPGSRWRFVLEAVEGGDQLEAADHEPGVTGDRLELLAVVRGLEALDQPSRVTLVTGSRYVSEGLRHGLPEWRDTDWQWESYGKMVPIKNQDLWQRVDRACRIHRVDCRVLRSDEPEKSPGLAASGSQPVRRFDGPMPVSGRALAGRPAKSHGARLWQWALSLFSVRRIQVG